MEQDNPMTAPAPKPDGVDVDELERQYATRDTEALGEHYARHVHAMTAEGLHEKSAIAAELAYRDMLIESFRASLAEIVPVLIAERDALRAENERLWANTGVGGCAGDAPEEMYVSGLATHGCDAWIHLVRVEVINGEVNERQAAKIAGGLYTQPVRYVRADVAEAARDALRADLEYMRRQRDAMGEKALRYDREVGEVRHERDALRRAVERITDETPGTVEVNGVPDNCARCEEILRLARLALATPGAGTGDGGGADAEGTG